VPTGRLRSDLIVGIGHFIPRISDIFYWKKVLMEILLLKEKICCHVAD
jgi:hypothetical protein